LPINWKHILALNGSQAEGFEEFISQLARREAMPQGAKFTRKGKPDAGIECYWTLPTSEEIVWQAKYFLSQEGFDWSQVDGSIKTALDKHPKLIQYYVCIPVDLPDARLTTQRSAFEKWQNHVTKWEGWAANKGMSVKFVWWGSHEMLEKLSSPANAGLAQFWFDAAVLDPDWFDKRLREAIVTAGPRYTKEVNVELPIVEDFDAFGRTAKWVSRLKRFASQISKVHRLASTELDKLGEQKQPVDEALGLVAIVITMLREITVEPTTPVSFKPILDQIATAESAIQSVLAKLGESARLEDEKPREGADRSYWENPFRSTLYRLYDVERNLSEAADTLRYTETLAQSVLLLLNGTAGMGKTHLFCDLAAKRQQAGLPTVLLMGQRFRQPAEPWTQALQQLDLAQWSAGDFVGALECVAQAANARVLVMIDALNEGAGRAIWPDHMSAFLELIGRSPWIAVAVSVRSNYEEFVLPANVIAAATRLTHEGFTDHEYDASKTFFKHYGIELPSTPLLAPEYRNPLFLKSICLGLKEAGYTRLPRGFHGITQVFQLYTGAINTRLAKLLDFDEKAHLVQKALKLFVAAFPSHYQQWLSRDEAMTLVDGLLPGRSFQSSLYQNLVGEGLLVEDLVPMGEGVKQEFVHLGYERLADHFTAEQILEKVRQTPNRSNQDHLTEDDKHLTSGVLESLFIQGPETLQQELLDFAPSVSSHWQWPDAYRQSLIWRSPKAFTDRTTYWFNKSITQEWDQNKALEIVLTLAIVPGHPWDADFLDRQLRKRKMPERDEWWSLKLHFLYGDERSAVHRIIDWALSLKISDVVEEESVRLASLTLAWLLSSSNRFLRDRAAKAAANLLRGREAAAANLVRTFASVDDLYIRERVLAIAYGVAMRSHNASQMQPLADAVLETVFPTSPIVAHHLLRDYARGVIERQHVLSPQSEELLARVRPPYGSKWPRIPSKNAIEKLEESLKAEGKDAFGAWRIAFSVLHDDFGRYVIGTNSWSTDWLSLRLDQPQWSSYSEQLQRFRAECNPALSELWEEYDTAESKYSEASAKKFLAKLRSGIHGDGEPREGFDGAIRGTEKMVKTAQTALLNQLSQERANELRSLWKTRRTPQATSAPKFDLNLTQRYVMMRVFDLGWTAKRFEYFDQHVIRYNGRESSKAERIGKKYQWIAYHEACALIADNFQYRGDLGQSLVEHAYEGPWQDGTRDIDPSHSLLSTKGDSGSSEGWWAPQFEPDWGDGLDGLTWAKNITDFPDINSLIQKMDSDGRSWLVADLSFDRDRPTPEGIDRDEVESRQFWCHVRSFLVRNEDVDAFVKWTEGVDFWGRWMPTVPSSHNMFLGEYLWSLAWKHSNIPYYGNDGWVRPAHGCPVFVRASSFEYHQASKGFDCSVDDGFTLHLPDEAIVRAMNLAWSGDAADFHGANDELLTQDPSAYNNGPAALLLRSDMIEEMRQIQGLSLCWIVLGERQAYLPGPMQHLGSVRISGGFTVKDGILSGSVKFRNDSRLDEGMVGDPIGEKRF